MQNTALQILAPKGHIALGKFQARVVVFIIRQKGVVLYVGWSRAVQTSCSRYFRKNGPLSNYDIKRLSFELILSTPIQAPRLGRELRHRLRPIINYQYNLPALNTKERSQHERFWEYYQQNSLVASKYGDHQSDQG
jgi:hypothetical protein